jgi:hypothetical protein
MRYNQPSAEIQARNLSSSGTTGSATQFLINYDVIMRQLSAAVPGFGDHQPPRKIVEGATEGRRLMRRPIGRRRAGNAGGFRPRRSSPNAYQE